VRLTNTRSRPHTPILTSDHRGSGWGLWFTESNVADGRQPRIGRVTTSGVVTEYAVRPRAALAGITGGPGRGPLVNGIQRSQDRRVTTRVPSPNMRPDRKTSTPSTSPRVRTEPSGSRNSTTQGRSGDGPPGTIKEYPVPSGGSTWGITRVRTPALWFTESGFNKIGRVSPSGSARFGALVSAGAGGRHAGLRGAVPTGDRCRARHQREDGRRPSFFRLRQAGRAVASATRGLRRAIVCLSATQTGLTART